MSHFLTENVSLAVCCNPADPSLKFGLGRVKTAPIEKGLNLGLLRHFVQDFLAQSLASCPGVNLRALDGSFVIGLGRIGLEVGVSGCGGGGGVVLLPIVSGLGLAAC